MAAASRDQTPAAPAVATNAVLTPSETVPEGSREVRGIDFDNYAHRSITVDELISGMADMGFQATAVGEAVRIINDMRAWKDAETGAKTTIFLGYTSNLISSGLRETLRYLVQHNHVSAIVTTAGGVEEDLIKCLAPTYLGSFATPGAGLRAAGMNRIGNLVVPNSNYCAFEDWVVPILDRMLAEQEESMKTDEHLHWTPSKIINRLGKEIGDERSVYYWAWKNDIPVFCPALTDGSLGDMMYFHTFKSSPEQLRMDTIEDLRKINSLAVHAKRAGMVILGGGVVKHHIANACLMRNGAESAVYINTAQEFDGSDAGARPDEAVSWGKIKANADSVKVYAEATVVFPLIVAATFAKGAPSPNHIHHSHTPLSSPPPQPADDVDMSTSTTLPQPPTGQNHDRQEYADAPMQDPDGLTNGHVEPAANTAEVAPANSVAVEVAAVDEDVMDTTPDNGQGLVLPNGSTGGQDAAAEPTSPAPNGVSGEQPASNGQPPAGDGTDGVPPSDSVPPVEPPPPVDPSIQPPPPPAEPVRSDSDSSDDDDGGQPWHPIQEDTSSPDEAELKEIEASVEVSALDHEHWEQKAFLPLEDPEYTPGESGRIEWVIENYNGTRENPNRDVVMKSQVVNIGGYDWQIKFYPKGNDSDFLSIYIECLSLEDSKKKEETHADQPKDAAPGEDAEMATDDATTASPAASEPRHTPLPLLDGKSLPKRKSVAAQVSVVLYNPTEPRVNYSRTCLRRFCTGSPDWGWTRFHGPHYDIPHRVRGQRQALLRDDKLAFTGYIRLVEDETECLWEHPSKENPWDSFAMTGLQSMFLSGDSGGPVPPGGNLISALSSWLLFKPFRHLLYSLKIPDLVKEPLIKPGVGPVALDDLMDAFEWYGICDRLDKLDVMEVWEVLRLKLEEELRDTAFSNILEDVLGRQRNYASGIPSYRVRVLGVDSMQAAVDHTVDLTDASKPPPQLLTIELERQEFDIASRSYVKLLNKVSLDDHISIRGTPYTLYGFIVHKQTLQSYIYHPILRPEGPGSKWYIYPDKKDEYQVKCLTKRQAIDAHEGKTGGEKLTGNDPIAYIVMYVRDDVGQAAFKYEPESEEWDVPEWIRSETDRQQTLTPPPLPSPPSDIPAPDANSNTKPEETSVVDEKPPKEQDFQVISSKAFLQHEGPGIMDIYEPRWLPESSEHVHTVRLLETDGCDEIREKLAAVVGEIKDPRQIKFWFLDSVRGTWGRPNLLGTGNIEYSSGSIDHYANNSKPWILQDHAYAWTACRIWVHIVDFAALPELPKEEPKEESKAAEPGATELESTENQSLPTENAPDSNTALPQSEVVQPSEDTPMSEPDDPVPTQTPTLEPQPLVAQSEPVPADTPMNDAEAAEAVPADPPATDVIVPNPDASADTEMSGTQENIEVPPPPPPADPQAEIPPPPPPTEPPQETQQEVPQNEPPPPPPDEIYFFLKFFDPESQSLQSRGSHIALKTARVDSTVISILDLPIDKKIELIEEEELASTRPIRNRRSFAQNDLHNTVVIVVTFPLTEDQRSALAARAAFADLQSYLAYRAQLRNFPAKLNGHFTYNYFSSQFYKGEIKNFHHHGHGTEIYHSGATYSGSFRLSQRHGHGLYTFQNGDTYDGEWAANQQHGLGTFVEGGTGNTYVGGWKNDKKFGEGVTHWKNAQETERLCRICWEETADAAFYDCGHVVACLGCARRVDSCPVCRKRVLSAMKLFYVA
ncbi:DS-domain-containing protein [Polyplosphaeria fusca]|uniref:Deoxyhypusine synthase n=1 Tax=Polyplosphaeria fusca TaxID=682080 RepID=A0A9P4R0I4_9PLEO|nr:DS-domain-containing protein [Polyplosphaeria fusca]